MQSRHSAHFLIAGKMAATSYATACTRSTHARVYAQKHGLTINAYCLMTKRVHLVAVPASQGSLAGALKPVHLRYTQHVN